MVHWCVSKSVVMWLHILVGPGWCLCMLHCSEVLYFRSVQHTHTILTCVTLASTNNALPEDSMTAPNHVLSNDWILTN